MFQVNVLYLLVYIIIKKVRDTSASKNLKLQWIPSHINIKGKEEADRLTKLRG